MARPDCDDGWLKYAHELDAALAVADFSKGARIVLREVFAQIYGPAKLPTATLSPTDIANRVGTDKGHVGHSIRELTDAGILRKQGDSYTFIKDYESWTRPGKDPETGKPIRLPRLSKSEVAYAAKAAKLAMSHKATAPVKTDAALSIQTTRRCLSRQRDVVYPDNATLSIQTTDVVYPDNAALSIQTTGAVEERARVVKTFKTGDKEKTTPPVVVVVGTDDDDADAGKGVSLDDLIKTGEELRPGFGSAIRTNAGRIDRDLGGRLDCFDAAMRRAGTSTCHIKNLFGYVLTIAKGYRETGIEAGPLAFAPRAEAVVEPPESPSAARARLIREELLNGTIHTPKGFDQP